MGPISQLGRPGPMCAVPQSFAPASISTSSSISNSNRDSAPGLGRAADRLRSVRSRLRTNQHQAAHDDHDPRRGSRRLLDEHPLVPPPKAGLVTSDDQLADLVDTLRQPIDGQPPRFAYDSEFIGESTYHPKLCLIQVATTRNVALIDPLGELDLTAFWELVGDASVQKIVHAGEQDLEPAIRLAGIEPANVFDTQIAAGFCSLPYPTSLAKLVEHVSASVNDGTGIRLGKGLTFTQWDQRPLSKKQLAYAADDVRFLLLVADWIQERLSGDERANWCGLECDLRASRDRLVDDDHPWDRVRGSGVLDGKQQAILRRLATWRDASARAENLPPRVLMRDEVLVNLSKRPPANLSALSQAKFLPRPVAERYGDEMLGVIEQGKADDPIRANSGRPVDPTLEDRFIADAAWALLQTIGHARGIDPNLLASRRETELLVRRFTAGRDTQDHSLMTGWRKDAAGDRLLDLLDGGSMTFRWTPTGG